MLDMLQSSLLCKHILRMSWGLCKTMAWKLLCSWSSAVAYCLALRKRDQLHNRRIHALSRLVLLAALVRVIRNVSYQAVAGGAILCVADLEAVLVQLAAAGACLRTTSDCC